MVTTLTHIVEPQHYMCTVVTDSHTKFIHDCGTYVYHHIAMLMHHSLVLFFSFSRD